jgi:kynurenine formamidase
MPDANDLSVLQKYIDQCSNWGRWGADDELGAVNLITEAKVREGVSLVKYGKSIPLTMAYDNHGPQRGSASLGGRNNPTLYQTMTGAGYLMGEQDFLPPHHKCSGHGVGFYDDILMMPTQSGTQWDALCHAFWDGKMYNGRSASEAGGGGARRNGVHHYTGKIVTRGVFVDFPEFKGVPTLDPGYAISVDDFEKYLAAKNLKLRPGDALLVRTGFMAARRGNWGDYAGGPSPGLSLHTAPWIRENDIAAIATDTWGLEVLPNEIDCFQPLHVVALVHTGVAFGEMFDFDALSADCRSDGVYEFLFVASPLPLTGASGGPVSGLAIK